MATTRRESLPHPLPVRTDGPAPAVSVVIPLYNEAESVSELYRRTADALNGFGRPYELIFVDDGSSDSTFAEVERAHAADDHVRANLVGVARRRAGANHGVAFGAGSTVVVGDTPYDVAAGRDGGARVVAVASGRATEAELRDAGAVVVLPDLTDTAALLRAVLVEQP